ncbi:hypothetical protein [Kitasatospora sp. NPDC057541]|uniref:hypothetical protein n=1 Tax=unclassified Kitasatospora TaxID=2633591 RepID=UPI00368B3D8E
MANDNTDNNVTETTVTNGSIVQIGTLTGPLNTGNGPQINASSNGGVTFNGDNNTFSGTIVTKSSRRRP